MKYKINWLAVSFLAMSTVFYIAGKENGRNAQITESLMTEEELQQYQEDQMKEIMGICMAVWKEQNEN